jgi:hypothetical protein
MYVVDLGAKKEERSALAPPLISEQMPINLFGYIIITIAFIDRPAARGSIVGLSCSSANRRRLSSCSSSSFLRECCCRRG